MNSFFCRTCQNKIVAQAVICTSCGCKPRAGKSYCFSCGEATHAHAQLCTKCGVSLQDRFSGSDLLQQEAFRSPVFWAAVFVVIAFFLPWFNFFVIEISGWELRDLVRYIKSEKEDFEAGTFLNLMYFLPVSSGLIISSFFTQNSFIQNRVRSWKILTGLYPYLFVLTILIGGKDGVSDYFAYGLYITLASSGFLLYNGIRHRRSVISFVDTGAGFDTSISTLQIKTTPSQPEAKRPTTLQEESTVGIVEKQGAAVDHAADISIVNEERPPRKPGRLLLISALLIFLLGSSFLIYVWSRPQQESVVASVSTDTVSNNYDNLTSGEENRDPIITRANRRLQYLYHTNAGLIGLFDDGTASVCARCDLAPANVEALANERPFAYFEEMDGYVMVDGSQRLNFYINGQLSSEWAMYNYDWKLDIEADTAGFPFQGSRMYCDEEQIWSYLVTITGDRITLELYKNEGQGNTPVRSNSESEINGKIVSGRIITSDASEYLADRFSMENGVLYEVNNEGGKNPYYPCGDH